MDILSKKQIVRQLIEEIGKMTPADEHSETQIILDEEGGHFVLFDLGWQHKRRIYLPFVHVDVKPDGKVWIQHDGTDLHIAQLLSEKGIEKADIVLAFKAPHVRKLMADFATA